MYIDNQILNQIIAGCASVAIILMVGLVALLNAKYDLLGRIIIAIIVGQALFGGAAGMIDILGMRFDVMSATLVASLIALLMSMIYRCGPSNTTGLSNALPAVIVLLFFWCLQLVAALKMDLYHYDFTYYHDLLSRILAKSGDINDPYLNAIGYDSWYLSVYGSSVAVDAFNYSLSPGIGKMAWYLNALILPVMLILYISHRAGGVSSLGTSIIFVALFPLMLFDPRPHYTIALLLGLASVTMLTVTKETMKGDAVFLALLTVSAVLAKREAFIIFFFPCLGFFLILILNQSKRLAWHFGALAGVPVLLTLGYRVIVPEHSGLSVGSQVHSSINTMDSLIRIIGERVVANNGNITIAMTMGLIAVALQVEGRKIRMLWIVVTQFVAFIFFIYVTEVGGLNNYSTDERKAVYPLIVAACMLGVAIGRFGGAPRFRLIGGLFIGVFIGIALTYLRGDLANTSRAYLQSKNNWNELLDRLGLENIQIFQRKGEVFYGDVFMGSHIRPQGLYAALYPREIGLTKILPDNPNGTIFLASETGVVPEFLDLDGRIYETTFGLRYWTKSAVPREATNGWSMDYPKPDEEIITPLSVDDKKVHVVSAWGSLVAISQAAPGEEINIKFNNSSQRHLSRLLIDPYPGYSVDAPVYVKVFNSQGMVLYASQFSDLPRFNSWIIPIDSRSNDVTVQLRVGDTGTLRFYRPRMMAFYDVNGIEK